MGNLRSVIRGLEHAGASPRASSEPEEVLRADRVVLPGVAHLADAMKALDKRGLSEAIRERVRAARPYLGICIGLQVLLERGEEGPTAGLGLLRGTVGRFPSGIGLPVPHMGWNRVQLQQPHPVLREGYYYFVHSYRAEGVSAESVLATTDYGAAFPSALGSDGCVAVQFHPEKSQRAGLALLERFCRWRP
jgi:glutamine amidotransferase